MTQCICPCIVDAVSDGSEDDEDGAEDDDSEGGGGTGNVGMYALKLSSMCRQTFRNVCTCYEIMCPHDEMHVSLWITILRKDSSYQDNDTSDNEGGSGPGNVLIYTVRVLKLYNMCTHAMKSCVHMNNCMCPYDTHLSSVRGDNAGGMPLFDSSTDDSK